MRLGRSPGKAHPDVVRVRAALIKSIRTTRLTHTANNSGMPRGWLQQLIYGNIKDPGYSRIVRLAQHFGIELIGYK